MSEKFARNVAIAVNAAMVATAITFTVLANIYDSIELSLLAVASSVLLIVYSFHIDRIDRAVLKRVRRMLRTVLARRPRPRPVLDAGSREAAGEAYATRWTRVAGQLRDPDAPPPALPAVVSYRELWLTWLLFGAALAFAAFAAGGSAVCAVLAVLCSVGAAIDLLVHLFPGRGRPQH